MPWSEETVFFGRTVNRPNMPNLCNCTLTDFFYLFPKHWLLFVCVQIHWLWQHLHQTQWQSGFKDSFKLPLCLPYQQTEGQTFLLTFISLCFCVSQVLTSSWNVSKLLPNEGFSVSFSFLYIPRVAIYTLDNDA